MTVKKVEGFLRWNWRENFANKLLEAGISGNLASGGEGGIRTLDTLARMPDFESSVTVEHSCGFHDDLGLQKQVFECSGTRIESRSNLVLQTKSSVSAQLSVHVSSVNNALS